MPEKQSEFRLEDRYGLTQGSFFAKINTEIFHVYLRVWRRLPAFRGKVRVASLFKRILQIDNQHIIEKAKLTKPTQYNATLDIHSWHEFLAYTTGGYEADTTEFLLNCYDGKGCFLDLGANIGLISLPFSILSETVNSFNGKPVYCIEGNLRDGAGTGTANIMADDSAHPCERVLINITTIDAPG
ncbi:MAG: hypothetical protein ACI9FR_000439 [Cryomorphaceae bacterium]|jgi:hypothetical protein